MKTRLIVLIISGVIISGSFAFVYAQMYDCLNPPMWMKGPRSSFDHCWGLFLNGYLPDYTDEREKYEEKIFNRTMEKKATLAFNMTLASYGIDAEKLTVRQGFKTMNEFYMAQAVTENNTRYFLMSSFEKDESPDKITIKFI